MKNRNPLRELGAVVALALVVSAAACAHLAPGADPVVVRTEQFLTASDGAYASLMKWYFSPGVASTLSPSVTRALEKVRTGFDAPYKKVQAALDRYKVNKSAGIRTEMAALQALLQTAAEAVGGLTSVSVPQIPAEVP